MSFTAFYGSETMAMVDLCVAPAFDTPWRTTLNMLPFCRELARVFDTVRYLDIHTEFWSFGRLDPCTTLRAVEGGLTTWHS